MPTGKDFAIAERSDPNEIASRIEAIYTNRDAVPLTQEQIDAAVRNVQQFGPGYFDQLRTSADQLQGTATRTDAVQTIEASGEGLGPGGSASEQQVQTFIQTGQITAATVENAFDEDAFALIETILRSYGLEGLIPWAQGLIETGRSPAQIQLELYEQPAFQERFPGIFIRQENGFNAITPAEYLAYENTATALLRGANLPEGFYDDAQDFAELIGQNVTVQQLGERINQGYLQVANAPTEVRQAFANYFGPNGDSALASFFLDPDRAENVLLKAADTAAVGGQALRFGFELQRSGAERIQTLGLSQSAREQGFSGIQAIAPLFQETITEKQDFTPDVEGINSAFNLDPNARDKIRRRLEERVSRFGGAGGGAISTQRGFVGLGSSARL